MAEKRVFAFKSDAMGTMKVADVSAAKVRPAVVTPQVQVRDHRVGAVARPRPAGRTVALAESNLATQRTIVHRRADIRTDVFLDARYVSQFPIRPWLASRRADLTVPVAPAAAPTDADVFESPDGTVRYALPRYALQFDRVGTVDEPRIAIADRDGTPTLVITLNEAPAPASGHGVQELPHALAVTLKYQQPVLGGGNPVVQELSFPSVLLDPTQTIVTAERPLTTPGQRQQILGALGSPAAASTLVVTRGIEVGVPTGTQAADGSPGYRVATLAIDCVIDPVPLILSDAQRARLGGGAAAVQPLVRLRVPFEGKSYSYWQDPAFPELFYFLPDRFQLARAPDGDREPLLRIRARDAIKAEELQVIIEFEAHPTIAAARLDAARPTLEAAAKSRGATSPIRLEILPQAQPILRLALPQNGVVSGALVERRDTEIDLERGLTHGETLPLADFNLVYDALFGHSLSLLRGEIRVDAGGGEPDDIPLELRIDRTADKVLTEELGEPGPEGFPIRFSNPIESPVRIEHLSAVAMIGDTRTPLRFQSVEGISMGPVLQPGEAGGAMLIPQQPLPAGNVEIVVDQSELVVEPDRQALWRNVFDSSATPQLTTEIHVGAVPGQFVSADRPDDRVIAFVVTVERGNTVRLTETALEAKAIVQVPVEPLLTGAPVPPIRYRTETWWQSGGIGTSPWRETDSRDLLPVKMPPVAS
jgi:hypothetical protein